MMHGIAVVGAGNMGRAHARAWAARGLGDRIRYVCSRRPVEAFPHAAAARSVVDLDDVLGDPDVDLLSVCTPTPTHAEIAIRALDAGRNVLLEKPIALTVRDAEAIAAAESASPGRLMVAHVVRFASGYRRVLGEARAGRLGRVREVRAERRSEPPGWADWFADEARSGGPLVDFAIHDFDQVNLLLGRPVAVSTEQRGEHGRLETRIEYADGGVGHVVTCAAMPEGTPFSSTLDATGDGGTASCRVPGAGPDDPFARQASSFLKAIDSGAQPEVTIASATVALRVALAARESLHSGRPVELEQHEPAPAVG
ncbi:Gfo/Idh/MocA family oxidoreductase [Agromyces tropicus]|uniref:Gfo/Idh/MocA family oxidoreductase n=1 Tax=Agromyces tropicus TaxID=555371 RepID=A0ABP5GFM7_9MICO